MGFSIGPHLVARTGYIDLSLTIMLSIKQCNVGAFVTYGHMSSYFALHGHKHENCYLILQITLFILSNPCIGSMSNLNHSYLENLH
jgi:hypothetical protein